MRGLTKLYLTGTSITDEGMKNLAGLTNLTELALDGTGVSDAGLAHLAGLTQAPAAESPRIHRDRQRSRVTSKS